MQRFILLTVLFTFSLFYDYSQASTLPSSIEQNLQKAVDRFYIWANSAYGSNHHKPISNKELWENLNLIFTPDISHELNGKKVTANIKDLYQRFIILKHKYAAADVILPYDDIVIDNQHNKVVIFYKKVFTLHNGKKIIFHAMSFFHIRNGQVDVFNEVSSKEVDHL